MAMVTIDSLACSFAAPTDSDSRIISLDDKKSHEPAVGATSDEPAKDKHTDAMEAEVNAATQPLAPFNPTVTPTIPSVEANSAVHLSPQSDPIVQDLDANGESESGGSEDDDDDDGSMLAVIS